MEAIDRAEHDAPMIYGREPHRKNAALIHQPTKTGPTNS